MTRVSRFWPLAMATALAVVVAGLTLPQTEAAAAAPADVVAPALPSRSSDIEEPQVPEGQFLPVDDEAAPQAVEEVSPEPIVEEQVDRDGLTLEKRREFQNIFVDADGAQIVQQSALPLNARDEDGKWVPVEPTFHQDADGWETNAHPLAPRLEQTADDSQELVVERGGHEVSVALVGAEEGRLESPFWFWDDWSTVTNRDVRDGQDREFELTPSSVKDSIILNERPAESKNSWSWRIDAGELEVRLSDDDVLEFVDANGKVIIASPTPLAWDSSPVAPQEDRVELVLDASLTELSEGVWRYTVKADRDWLQSPDRQYPVVIDPELVVVPAGSNAYKSNGAVSVGELHVGNTAEVSGGYFWRGVAAYSGGDFVGKLIEGASVGVAYDGYGATGTFSGTVKSASKSCYGCFVDQLATYSLGSGSAITSGAGVAQYLADRFAGGSTAYSFMLTGTETSAYSHKRVTTDLWVKYHAHVVPSIVAGSGASPANTATGVSLTPTLKLNRPRFDAVSFRVWKEDIDHAEDDSGGDEAASDPACARSSR